MLNLKWLSDLLMKEKTLSPDYGSRILNRKLLSNWPMKENIEEKVLWFEEIFRMVRPIPSETAKKAENNSKEGHINTTVGKSGGNPLDS